jgi:hypothetical protein
MVDRNIEPAVGLLRRNIEPAVGLLRIVAG